MEIWELEHLDTYRTQAHGLRGTLGLETLYLADFDHSKLYDYELNKIEQTLDQMTMCYLEKFK